MKKILIYATLLFTLSAQGQENLPPSGSNIYQPQKTACLSQLDYALIKTMLKENIKILKAYGTLPKDWGERTNGSAAKPTTGTLIWPLKQQPGFSYNSYYGISNYVDHNPLNPNRIMDYSCGNRTYDMTGYNHQGIDIFLWPFDQNMMADEQVAIVAAADGIIISKQDGNFDQSCAMGGGNWNAVYIGNTDGSISWYGHMKMNSTTTKQAGQSVVAGEVLGFVGSSGNSTGPHLHFENYDANGNLVDPYTGSCNLSPSLWVNQKPYMEPTINAVLTHSAQPVYRNCPQLDTKNVKDTFEIGDPIVFGVYYHDQIPITSATFKVIAPNNVIQNTWTQQLQAYYVASSWFWNFTVTSSWLPGQWRIEVTYEGNTVSHPFFVKSADEGTAVKSVASEIDKFKIVPNANHGTFSIIGLAKMSAGNIAISNAQGKVLKVLSVKEYNLQNKVAMSLQSGMYFVTITTENALPVTLKFVVQ